MSIRTNKMKAVGVVLKQLMTTRSRFHERGGDDESFDGKLEKLRLNLNKIKDVFVRVKKNEEELLDTLAEVYGHLRKLERRKLDEEIDGICNRIKDCAQKLVPIDRFDESSKEEDPKVAQIFYPSPDFHEPHPEIWTRRDFDRLDFSLDVCLLSLLIFPENVVIRKRNAINLWIGEGLIEDSLHKTAEELCEGAIHDLLESNMIVRCGNRKSPIADKFRILPGVPRNVIKENLLRRRESVVHRLGLEQKRVTLGDGGYFGERTIRTVYNIGASYLNFRPKWASELKNVEVLQLGRWQDLSFHHIEVGSEEFLKDLGNLTQLRYLSLCGISRIFELPSSIAQLERLLILDLKACHNLERLPNDISSMKSLTHLILSQCYLLEGMPKGINKLTNLQVLKGFVISTAEKTPCKISDLVNLRKLRRLSIYIGREAVMRDREFEGLEDFAALEHLKICWRGFDPSYANIHLPLGLRKLHLECFPRKSIQELFMPPNSEGALRELNIRRGNLESMAVYGFRVRELNISGGKLESIDVDRKWRNVRTLRLKYLKQLNVDINKLKRLFPRLINIEIKQIGNYDSYMKP